LHTLEIRSTIMTHDAEKSQVVVPSSDVARSEECNVDGEDEFVLRGDHPRIKKIKRKTDLRIVTLLGLLYMMAAIDRVNLPVCSSLQASNRNHR
jgi:hypothetical protein